MFLHVTKARYLKDFMVEISFNNGRKGTADLANTLKGKMFEPLRKKSEFSTFTIDKELETIVWPNGADLAPEYLYFQAFKSEPELQDQFKTWGYIS